MLCRALSRHAASPEPEDWDDLQAEILRPTGSAASPTSMFWMQHASAKAPRDQNSDATESRMRNNSFTDAVAHQAVLQLPSDVPDWHIPDDDDNDDEQQLGSCINEKRLTPRILEINVQREAMLRKLHADVNAEVDRRGIENGLSVWTKVERLARRRGVTRMLFDGAAAAVDEVVAEVVIEHQEAIRKAAQSNLANVLVNFQALVRPARGADYEALSHAILTAQAEQIGDTGLLSKADKVMANCPYEWAPKKWQAGDDCGL